MLKIISYAASAYSLATAAAGTAVTKAGEEAYKKAAEKAVEEAAKKGAVSATTKATLKSTFEAAGYSSMYAHPLFEGAKWAEIGASSLPGATNALTNQAANLVNTPGVGEAVQTSLYPGQNAYNIGSGLQSLPPTADDAFFGYSGTSYTPADISQVGGSTGAVVEPSWYGAKAPSADFAGGLAPPASTLDDEFFRVLLDQKAQAAEAAKAEEFFKIHGFDPRKNGGGRAFTVPFPKWV